MVSLIISNIELTMIDRNARNNFVQRIDSLETTIAGRYLRSKDRLGE